MEYDFTGPRYTVGIEEELMILNPTTLDLVSGINSILGEKPPTGSIKPELLESVLEIATDPCPDVPTAGEGIISLRAFARERARSQGLSIGAAGTHPFARWEDQRVVNDARYHGLVHSLGFVARQELVFGMHVHVGMADPEETIYVANGLHPHVPLLIALAANSPLWRGDPTGLASSRVPIFRAFPRVGLPPRYEDWEDYEHRVGSLVNSGLIEDYTYLWYDVRPHPRLGTIEIRAMDSQTRVESTISLSALVVSLVKHLVEEFKNGARLPDIPWEILDENRWLAARHGLEAELLDYAAGERRAVRATVKDLMEHLRPHAQDLGCEEELLGIDEILRLGNGAIRQQKSYGANHDLHELVSQIVAATA